MEFVASMAVRLIVFDLDGTLLDARNRLSDHTAAVLREARADGLVLVGASGRSRWAADLVLEETDAIDHVICSNGAVLYHRPSGKVLRRSTITPPRLSELHATISELLDGACWAWETEQGIVPDEAFRELGTRPGSELDELMASPHLELAGDAESAITERLTGFGRIVRGLLARPGLTGEEIARHLKGRKVPARLSSSSAIFLEVTAPRIDKRAMLRYFCAREGIDAREVVAFGDHMNDLSMLRWAGRGIAMADANPKVKQLVAEHTEYGHGEDGVARVIQKLLADRRSRSAAGEDLHTPRRPVLV